MTISCFNCPLRRSDAFQNIDDDELQFIQSVKNGERTVDAGASVVVAGESRDHFYTILSGAGLRHKFLPDGRRQVVNFVFPGDLVGLQDALLGKMCHGVAAVTEMTLCRFDGTRLWDLYRNHPERAYDLTWLAAAEVKALGDALISVGRRGARERIAYLMHHIMRRGIQSGFAAADKRMRFPFRQRDLADAAGLSLVHTNKMIQDLRSEDVISLKEGVLTVLDVEALQNAAAITEAERQDPPKARPLL